MVNDIHARFNINISVFRILNYLKQHFQVPFSYNVYFTKNLFDQENNLFARHVEEKLSEKSARLLFVCDRGVVDAHPSLISQITSYIKSRSKLVLSDIMVVPGGEACKNDSNLVTDILKKAHDHNIDRHSYIVGLGGGAVLDLAGYAAAITHRGVRHIRIPTTVLSQNDSGVGVKNGINLFGKKNFAGTFAPPFSVLNDSHFLTTLDDRDWRSGISEAIKVALIKDSSFYDYIEDNITALQQRDEQIMQHIIYICADLHMEHIRSGDPFEMGSSRPLDFGHWAAHKLEQLSNYDLRHGEAVAIGICLDCTYSYLRGMLSEEAWARVLKLFNLLGFDIYTDLLEKSSSGQLAILKGLDEFREHLGGQLTIMLLEDIGQGVEVHLMDKRIISKAIRLLGKKYLKLIDS